MRVPIDLTRPMPQSSTSWNCGQLWLRSRQKKAYRLLCRLIPYEIQRVLKQSSKFLKFGWDRMILRAFLQKQAFMTFLKQQSAVQKLKNASGEIYQFYIITSVQAKIRFTYSQLNCEVWDGHIQKSICQKSRSEQSTNILKTTCIS